MRETQTPDLLTLPNCLLAVFSSQHLALDQAWLQNKGCANVGDKRLLSARLTFSRLGVFVRRYSKVKFVKPLFYVGVLVDMWFQNES